MAITDIFQTKRKKREAETNAAEEEEEEEEDYDVWYDYDVEGSTPVSITPRIDFTKYSRENSRDTTETTSSLPRSILCDLVNTLDSKCGMTSLLEMWRYEEETIKTTTHQEILAAVNQLSHSPWTGYETDFTSLLGGVERDSRGRVVTARTALMVWSLTVPDDAELLTNQPELEFADATTLGDISRTLIGRAPTLLGSYWSRASKC